MILRAAAYLMVNARRPAGLPYCKVVPVDGPRSAPLTRGLVATLRAYVNPQTGAWVRVQRAPRSPAGLALCMQFVRPARGLGFSGRCRGDTSDMLYGC